MEAHTHTEEVIHEFEVFPPTRDQLLEMAAVYLLAEEGLTGAIVRLIRIEVAQESADAGDVDGAADDALDVPGAVGTGDADDAPGLGGHDGPTEQGDGDGLVRVVDDASPSGQVH